VTTIVSVRLPTLKATGIVSVAEPVSSMPSRFTCEKACSVNVRE
jgi:hypothetical protein